MAKPAEIKPGVYWVGAIDWNLRYFHGYLTPRGSSYNAYLIVDDKIVLVDTVKQHLFDEMMQRIAEVIDPSRIDYLVVNHVEMDHSGSVPNVMEVARDARIVTSPNGKKGLEGYYKGDWDFLVVDSGAELRIGSRELTFVHTPMVHWPDSMVTYIPKEKLLLPNDAFGQHIAGFERFDDEIGWDVVHEEAAKYYANIVLPYGDQVNKALDVVSRLQIEMIAPSHGVIWRSFVPRIVDVYRSWACHETEKRALIVYDTMWGSTGRIAAALQAGLEDTGLPVSVRWLQTSHISEIMLDVLLSRLILVGSPTLNNGMLPTVAAFLAYVGGLRPRNRVGFAFGSYGWGGQGAREVKRLMEAMGWKVPRDIINIQYRPGEQELKAAREAGRELGGWLKATV